MHVNNRKDFAGASAKSVLDLPFAKKTFREFMDGFSSGTAAVYALVEHRWMKNLKMKLQQWAAQ